MIAVSDIYDEVKQIIGSCDDPSLFRTLTRAVELLANKGEFDPLLGEVMVNGQENVITLPREVETPMAVEICNRPAMGRDVWFSYHFNGPGSEDEFFPVGWEWWKDGAQSSTFRDLTVGSRLVAEAERVEDVGLEVWAYGYDENGNFVRTAEGGEYVNGYRVPLDFEGANTTPSDSAPVFSRVVRVRLVQRVGAVRLYAVPTDDSDRTLIGHYQWDEQEPLYRRIKISATSETEQVKIAFRRRVFRILSTTDAIPLHSELALIEAVRAIKAYGDDDVALAQAHEATAYRLLAEKQESVTPPVMAPIQISGISGLVDQSDYLD